MQEPPSSCAQLGSREGEPTVRKDPSAGLGPQGDNGLQELLSIQRKGEPRSAWGLRGGHPSPRAVWPTGGAGHTGTVFKQVKLRIYSLRSYPHLSNSYPCFLFSAKHCCVADPYSSLPLVMGPPPHPPASPWEARAHRPVSEGQSPWGEAAVMGCSHLVTLHLGFFIVPPPNPKPATCRTGPEQTKYPEVGSQSREGISF